MDAEEEFAAVEAFMKKGEYDNAKAKVNTIAEGCSDVFTLIKCASVLKAAEDDAGCRIILRRAADVSKGIEERRMAVAVSIRDMGMPAEAYELMKNEKDNDGVLHEKAKTLLMMDESEEALAQIRKIGSLSAKNKILMCGILCSLGEFGEAHEIASELDKNDPSYRSSLNLCNTLILMGKGKDAVRYAKNAVKERKDADSLAVAAHVMRITGHTAIATAYAHRSLTIDDTHIGALETMAYCLIEKSKFTEAKICAGAINEVAPGDPAVIRILDACRASR